MKKRSTGHLLIFLVLVALLSTGGALLPDASPGSHVNAGVRPAALAAATAPGMGTASSFAVLGGSTVTNTGLTSLNGNLGVWPGTEITGFPPGTVNNGSIYAGDDVAAQAQADAGAAYNDLASQACDTNLSGQELGGLTLTPGVYCFDSSAGLTGELVLDAEGDSGAVWVFQIGSTLTAAGSVSMINGGSACNVYWQVGSSATVSGSLAGTIIALTSITLNSASMHGSALALNGAVTMDSSNVQACASGTMPTPTSEATATSEATLTPTSEATVTPTSEASPTPTSEATAAPTDEATVTPTGEAMPTPTGEATVTPTGEAMPTPTDEAMPTPTGEAMPTPTSEASPTPTSEATAVPTSEATAVPTSEATAVPTSAPTTAPTGEVSPTPSAPSVIGFPVTGGVATLQDEGHSALRLSPGVPSSAQPLISQPFIDPSLDLRASPVEVPLELRIPSLGISAPVLAVGITSKNVMDAPQGLADDPVWQTAFWYRGSGIPGDVGTATIAGHVDGIRGRPALFALLKYLRPGDLIIVHNTRSGLGVRFLVTEVETYSTQQATDPSVLARIYGSGPVSGKGPQPAPDDLSHLTLITCSGNWVQGAYDHRLVVYAQREQVSK